MYISVELYKTILCNTNTTILTGLLGQSHLRMIAFLLTWKYLKFFPAKEKLHDGNYICSTLTNKLGHTQGD